MKHMVVTINVEEHPTFTLEELCVAGRVSPDFIQELLNFGIIELEHGKFNARHLHRVRVVRHLQKDLEVNLAGAAVVLDLMEQMEVMRKRIELLQRYVQL